MTPEEFKEKMNDVIKSGLDPIFGFDAEIAHVCADNLMRELLIQLGYEEGVQIFDNMPKYYS